MYWIMMNFGRLLSWSPDIKRKNALEGGGGGVGRRRSYLYWISILYTVEIDTKTFFYSYYRDTFFLLYWDTFFFNSTIEIDTITHTHHFFLNTIEIDTTAMFAHEVQSYLHLYSVYYTIGFFCISILYYLKLPFP